MDSVVLKIKEILFGRKAAYERVFNEKDKDVQIILKDLGKFCRASESTFHMDARAHAVAEGRREVWLRIMNHTNLNQEEFFKKYGKDLP